MAPGNVSSPKKNQKKLFNQVLNTVLHVVTADSLRADAWEIFLYVGPLFLATIGGSEKTS